MHFLWNLGAKITFVLMLMICEILLEVDMPEHAKAWVRFSLAMFAAYVVFQSCCCIFAGEVCHSKRPLSPLERMGQAGGIRRTRLTLALENILQDEPPSRQVPG